MLVLESILAVWTLWVFFTAAMRLKMVRDAGKLTTGMKVFGYPLIAIGLTIDFLLQIIFSIPFLELPKEFTVSGRLWRLSNGADGWRKKFATFLRTQFLDAIDPSGVHTG